MRQSGYYWIKIEFPDNRWIIGAYSDKYETWQICGIDYDYDENDIEQIGDKIEDYTIIVRDNKLNELLDFTK